MAACPLDCDASGTTKASVEVNGPTDRSAAAGSHIRSLVVSSNEKSPHATGASASASSPITSDVGDTPMAAAPGQQCLPLRLVEPGGDRPAGRGPSRFGPGQLRDPGPQIRTIGRIAQPLQPLVHIGLPIGGAAPLGKGDNAVARRERLVRVRHVVR